MEREELVRLNETTEQVKPNFFFMSRQLSQNDAHEGRRRTNIYECVTTREKCLKNITISIFLTGLRFIFQVISMAQFCVFTAKSFMYFMHMSLLQFLLNVNSVC